MTVLFACAENKKRSQMAEVIFNSLAKSAKAVSAGKFSAKSIDPQVLKVFQKIVIKPTNLKSKKLTEKKNCK